MGCISTHAESTMVILGGTTPIDSIEVAAYCITRTLKNGLSVTM